ncbi:ADP-ribosyl cyclase/cyclic ADP-ribose hydrolase [Caenorhabditis elegans]|uniref:ADP-ribosyl cyclase/cyclic ADP-ribose hydrolase n=1 Tax=Caenorhabditis elegans TaxID=6239 RepID=O62408_CAEEL|nr:ADP-ribosyl cyclase/cyclic ADP-ribose hydrolase [Caenorhabditis elegans]CAA16296.4 ADP-ribosyl cyclase/cyclic ADP-ribose hydrolase [Caenorhabditis elegans]|eukprot:NP_507652.3 Uncharacterized protein CELE_Y17D7C.2 [Caenorhabditis elegans]
MHLFTLLLILLFVIVLGKEPSLLCDVTHLSQNSEVTLKFSESQRYFLVSCQCTAQLAGRFFSKGLLQKAQINSTQWDKYIPTQLWYGGEKIEPCWKRVDRHLAFQFCGVRGAYQINEAWAVLRDCIESPKQQKCVTKFLDKLYEISKSDETKLTCHRYYWYMSHRTQIEVVLEDDNIVYVYKNSSLKSVDHKNHSFFLMDISKNESPGDCSDSKRATSACALTFLHCKSTLAIFNVNCSAEHSKCLSRGLASDICRRSFTARAIPSFVEVGKKLIFRDPYDLCDLYDL